MDIFLESKIGKYFIIVYALFALVVYAVAFFCGDSTCGLYIVLPILPWAFILTQDFGLSFPWAIYPVFVLLNASVVYVLGAAIEWTYNKYLDYKQAAQLKILNQREVSQRET